MVNPIRESSIRNLLFDAVEEQNIKVTEPSIIETEKETIQVPRYVTFDSTHYDPLSDPLARFGQKKWYEPIQEAMCVHIALANYAGLSVESSGPPIIKQGSYTCYRYPIDSEFSADKIISAITETAFKLSQMPVDSEEYIRFCEFVNRTQINREKIKHKTRGS